MASVAAVHSDSSSGKRTPSSIDPSPQPRISFTAASSALQHHRGGSVEDRGRVSNKSVTPTGSLTSTPNAFSQNALARDLELHRQRRERLARAAAPSSGSPVMGNVPLSTASRPSTFSEPKSCSDAGTDESEEDAWVMQRYRNAMIKGILAVARQSGASPTGSLSSNTSSSPQSQFTPQQLRTESIPAVPAGGSVIHSGGGGRGTPIPARRSLGPGDGPDQRIEAAIEILARLTKDQIDLCRQVENSLRSDHRDLPTASSTRGPVPPEPSAPKASGFSTFTSSPWLLSPGQLRVGAEGKLASHYHPLERLQILRAVKCKKTFERARAGCIAFSALVEQFGLKQLTAGDVAAVIGSRSLCYLPPTVCATRDGTGILYIVADRIDLSADPIPLLRAALFELERGMFAMPSIDTITVIADVTHFSVKDSPKAVHRLIGFLADALKGRYLMRVRRILVFGMHGIVHSLMVQGLALKHLGWKLQQRTCSVKSLLPFVELDHLRRALLICGFGESVAERVGVLTDRLEGKTQTAPLS